jgi:ABC-2 type transport system permease protein/lipopolysaccharide transport system permease protein
MVRRRACVKRKQRQGPPQLDIGAAPRHKSGMVYIARAQTAQDFAEPVPPPQGRTARAWCDLRDGAAKSWMWTALALQDIRLRYRGSVLGPFWVTISTLVMAVSMGVIYAQLFQIDVATYVPYLTIGLIVWQLISTLVSEGCETFLRADGIIQQVPIPFSVHVYRTVCRNFLVMAHSLAIVPLGYLFFAMPVGWHLLAVIPGFALLALNGVWICLLLGLISARFRDVPPIVGAFLQVWFFLTPVIYPVAALRDWRSLAEWNPFFAAIDVVRAPLLGAAPLETSWVVLLISTAIGSAFAFGMFARFRSRIAYWM